MSLIQVPKSKEEIAEFLADGNSQGVPFIQGSDINDGTILEQTRIEQLDTAGSTKFLITLPSGRLLESAPIGPDFDKAQAGRLWVEAVRDNIVADAQERAAALQRGRREAILDPTEVGTDAGGFGISPLPALHASDQAKPVPHLPISAPLGESVPVPGSDPVEYAKSQLRAALERLSALADAEQQVAKWQRVVDSLTGGSPVKKKRRKKRKPLVLV